MTIITVPVVTKIVNANDVAIYNSVITGSIINSSQCLVPFKGLLTMPANAKSARILTPDCYFFEGFDDTHTVNSLCGSFGFNTYNSTVNAPVLFDRWIYSWSKNQVAVMIDYA